MQEILLPDNNDEIKNVLNDPVKIASLTKYMYWIPDNSLPLNGWFKVVDTQSEVPNGVPFQRCICMG